jgi:plastocyanin
VKRFAFIAVVIAATALAGCKSPETEMGNMHHELDMQSFYLPNAEASRIVSVATNGVAAANVLVQTHRAAVKETGPKETVEKFGEVYSFSPNFFAVRREEQTKIRFWNLQPDDNHGFMLLAPNSQVLINVWLPPLKETAYFFTFHEEGLYNFVCTLHPTVMMGQILVLPPKAQ